MKKAALIPAILICSLCLSLALTAQPGSGDVRGRVADKEGKPLAGVKVTLSKGQDADRRTTTDPSGLFRFPAVYPGPDYAIKAERLDYETAKLNETSSQLTSIQAATTDSQSKRQRDDAQSHFTVAEMLVISRYLHKLKRDTILGQEVLKALKKEEDAKRRELLEATRERKKYEKLKEVQQDKHNSEIETVLAKENDETGVNTFRQKTKELS